MFSALNAAPLTSQPSAGRVTDPPRGLGGMLQPLVGWVRRLARSYDRAHAETLSGPHREITDFPRGAVLVPIEPRSARR